MIKLKNIYIYTKVYDKIKKYGDTLIIKVNKCGYSIMIKKIYTIYNND